MTRDITKMGRAELEAYVKELESQCNQGVSRRSVIAAAIGLAGAGALGVYSTGTASAAPTGTFPKSTDDALLKLRADRVRLVARTSDPSSPTDGTMWYRGDL